jgi:prepilin-type N-terminal cleavage/methylation domain-containing protein
MRTRGEPEWARHGRGYTAVEVLLSMTVLAIGAAGVLSMQRAAIQANADARKLDTANAIAHTWLDRLLTDGTAWTLPSSVAPALGSNLGNTQWLQFHDTGAFFLPAIPATYAPTGFGGSEGESPAFDIFGRDLAAANAATAVFCVQVKIDTLLYDQLTPQNPLVLSATVEVFWAKSLVNSGPPSPGFCTGAPLAIDVAAYETANPGTYHIVYATAAIRKNPLQ